MNSFLRQSTASQSRALGPFLDDTDFKTPETGLTIANTDIKIVMNGAASVDKNSGGGTHRVNGEYGVTWDATDTATVGEMKVSVYVAGALIVFATYTVLEEAVYDSMFASGAAFNEIADAALKRDWTAVSGEASRSLLNAARLLRNHWDIAAGILTVTKEDDSTTAWTSVLTGAPGADPVSGSDPT